MDSQVLANQITDTYRNLGLGNIDSLREIYSEKIVFEDPAHRIEGLENMLQYFKAMYANVNDCRFEFDSVIVDQKHIVLTWVMHLSHPKLKKGLPIEIVGSSVLEIAHGKVERHRDYFDLGAMAYEHIPLIGKVVRGIKNRLGQ
jgi:ketosteroid isomerase-like protein